MKELMNAHFDILRAIKILPEYGVNYYSTMANNINVSTKKRLTIDKIINTVCLYYRIDREKLLENSRQREIVEKRQIAMYLCRLLTVYPSSTIGVNLGGKNHATVLHAVKNIRNLIKTDKKIEYEVNYLINIINDNNYY